MRTTLRPPHLLLAALAPLLALACDKPKTDPAPPAETAAPTAAPSASAPPAAPSETAAAAPSASTTTATAASGTPAASASAKTGAATKPTASAPAGPPDGTGVCGTKPLPNCPLQGWMKEHTAPAVAASDMAALGDAFAKIQTFAPAGYTNWASIAKDGAAAAQAGNMNAVKAACRSCHDQYKAKYKAELRTRPIP